MRLRLGALEGIRGRGARAGPLLRVSVRPEGTSRLSQNDAGEFVDLYVPRKCSASNRIIGAKDHASIQMNVAKVDKVTGRFNGQFKTYAICGAIRRMGGSDDSILRLAKNDGIVSKNF
ncbi:40S ribosomal protein S21-like [Trichosurus vulpecula]|uniref:40S ribosomal protein S21-like n=1 Tax=Trichosurus vulpecula TaxID=9337 RepID=UPI00186B26C3|nr:40S ribosomal protein S21-like [Trichosurus vulpecula]